MKAEQNPKMDMNCDRESLQKDFEEAAKHRIDELKSQSKTDKDALKAEIDDLKKEADDSYDNIKTELKDWDDPYGDEKAEVEDASNKVVKKEIDADYEDSVDAIEYETGHRVDSIERLMNEDMNKDYDKGVDAIYVNQSEGKFQHEKNHYADHTTNECSNDIKASYDDIAEANAEDHIIGKGCGCGSISKSDHYTANEKMDKNNLKEDTVISESQDKIKDYQAMYGGNSCKASTTSDSLQDNSSDKLKTFSSTTTQDSSDRIKDYTSEKSKGCGCNPTGNVAGKNNEINTRLKNSDIQDSIQDSDSDDIQGYTITEEYVMIITDDDSSLDDDQQDSSDEYKSQIGQDSYYQQRDNSSNEVPGMKCNSPKTYSKANTIQDNTSRNTNAKSQSCNYDLKQDILDEADRVMGDDMI